MGTNNIIAKAQRKNLQQSFQPEKVQRKMRNLILLISEAQRNFRNKFLIQLKRNAIPQLRNGIFVSS